MKFYNVFINNQKLLFFILINFFNFLNALQSLYNEGDDILELDVNTFNNSVYKKVYLMF